MKLKNRELEIHNDAPLDEAETNFILALQAGELSSHALMSRNYLAINGREVRVDISDSHVCDYNDTHRVELILTPSEFQWLLKAMRHMPAPEAFRAAEEAAAEEDAEAEIEEAAVLIEDAASLIRAQADLIDRQAAWIAQAQEHA